MSSIKTDYFEGDVAIGRNVAIGGDIVSQGDTHLKGNLEVDGYIDFKHSKNVCKGLYTTVEALRTAYPCPKHGWYAYVGETTPADIYVVENRTWVATGQQGGSEYLDLVPVREDISALKSDVSTLKETSNEHSESIRVLNEDVAAERERAEAEEARRLVVQHITLSEAATINADLNNTLDSLTIDNSSSSNRGYTQIYAVGQLVNVWNYPTSYVNGESVQTVEGTLGLFGDGTLGIGNTFRRFTRRHTTDGWSAWECIDDKVRANEQAIAAEIERAEAAEQALSDASVSSMVVTRTANEMTIHIKGNDGAEIASAKLPKVNTSNVSGILSFEDYQRFEKNEKAITAERERAEKAESELYNGLVGELKLTRTPDDMTIHVKGSNGETIGTVTLPNVDRSNVSGVLSFDDFNRFESGYQKSKDNEKTINELRDKITTANGGGIIIF